MSSIDLILDILRVRVGSPERLELEREAHELLKTQLLAPNGGASDPAYEETLIARAKAALESEKKARSAPELLAPHRVARDPAYEESLITQAKTALNTGTGAGRVQFAPRKQMHDDPFEWLSSEDIERLSIERGGGEASADDFARLEEIRLAAAVHAFESGHEVMPSGIVIVAGNSAYPVWRSHTVEPVLYIEHAVLPEGARAIRLGGYRFLISAVAGGALATLVGCKLSLLKSLAVTDPESGRDIVAAEIETKL